MVLIGRHIRYSGSSIPPRFLPAGLVCWPADVGSTERTGSGTFRGGGNGGLGFARQISPGNSSVPLARVLVRSYFRDCLPFSFSMVGFSSVSRAVPRGVQTVRGNSRCSSLAAAPFNLNLLSFISLLYELLFFFQAIIMWTIPVLRMITTSVLRLILI